MKTTVAEKDTETLTFPCLMKEDAFNTIVLVTAFRSGGYVGTVISSDQRCVGYNYDYWQGLVPFHGTVTFTQE